MDDCDCDHCCGLLVGPQGFIGAQGLFTIGTQGPIGAQGLIAIGAQGDQGFQAPGVNGLQGFDGSQGAVDGTGANVGSDGDIGPQGQIDLRGPQGSVGNIGPEGQIGAQYAGPIGYQGTLINGPQGNQGQQGTKQNAAGPQGPVGYQSTAFQSTITEGLTQTTLLVTNALSYLPTTFTVAVPSFLRVVIHYRIESISNSNELHIGLYNISSSTSVGPVGFIATTYSYRASYVIARNVPSGTYAIGVTSRPADDATVTFFDYSGVQIFK